MNKFKNFFLKYPLETLLITLSTIAAIILDFNAYSKINLQLLVYSSFGLIMVVPFVFAISLLKQSPRFVRSKNMLNIVYVVIIILSYIYMYLILPPIFIKPDRPNLPVYGRHSYTNYIERPQFLYEFFMPILLGILALILVAYFTNPKHQKAPSKTYLNIVLRLLISIALGFVYGLAVFIGLEIAHMGIRALWGSLLERVDISWHRVILLISFNFIANKVAINTFGIKSNEFVLQVTSWIKNFVKYVLIPLFILYSIILYPYVAQILITGKWPSNTVTPLSLVYSFIAIIIITILYFDLSKNQKRIIASLLPVIILMQLYGLYLRISAYGLTVNRAELFLLGIILLLIAFYFIFSKNTKLIITTYAGLVFVLLTPAVFYVSKIDQLSRFYKKLESVGIKIENNKIIPADTNLGVKIQKYWELYADVKHLWNYYGLSILKDMLSTKSLNGFLKKTKDNFYFYADSFLDWLHISDELSIKPNQKSSVYIRTYRLNRLIPESTWDNFNLGFKFFKTPLTIKELELVEYKNSYIQKENNKYILYTETDSFLVPQEIVNYLTAGDFYRNPQVILLKSNDNINTYYLITSCDLVKRQSSDKIEVRNLIGILIYGK